MRLLEDVRGRIGNYQVKSGLFHYHRGEYTQALDYLERALSQEDLPESEASLARHYRTQSHISAAEGFEEQGQTAKAIEAYSRALAENPDYADIHLRLGRILLAEGNRPGAIVAFRAAVAARPEYHDGHLSLAFSLLDEGDFEGATASFARLREISLAAIERACALGREALAQEDAPQARNWFRIAFSRDLRQFQERFRAAVKFLHRGRFAEAIAPLEEAIDMQAHFADVHNDLGVALVESGQVERGEASFRRSVELNPDYLVAHLNLAATLVRAGRRAEAEERLRFVVVKDPLNPAARSLLGEILEPGGATQDQERIP